MSTNMQRAAGAHKIGDSTDANAVPQPVDDGAPVKLSGIPTRRERASKIFDEGLAEFTAEIARLKFHFDYVANKLDSDLERMLYAALYFARSELLCCYGAGPSSQWRQELFLEAHKQVGSYTVDFALTVPASVAFDGEEIRIAIECDGFYYHDRTPKQAEHDKKRDRYLALHGWRVMRFAEAEIVRDARGCAEQVIHYLDQLLHEQIRRFHQRAEARS